MSGYRARCYRSEAETILSELAHRGYDSDTLMDIFMASFDSGQKNEPNPFGGFGIIADHMGISKVRAVPVARMSVWARLAGLQHAGNISIM